MPFIAECPYCKKGKIRAPDNAVGWSAECPNPDCGSFFTLMRPPKEAAPAAAPAARLTPAALPLTTSPAAEPSLAAAGTGTLLQEEAPREVAAPQPILRRPRPSLPPPDRPSLNPFAVLSLVLGSAGLVCASLPVVDVASLPLAGIGLVLGLLGILYAVGRETGLGLAGVGPLVSAATLVVVTLLPSLIDARRGMVGPPPPDPHQRLVAPLAHTGAAGRTADENEWIDASSGAVQLGDAWLRVTGASVEQIGLEIQGQRDLSSGHYLVIRLQLANNGATRRIDYQTWAQTAQGPSKHRVRLNDQTGQLIPQAAFPPGPQPVGQLLTGSIYPGKSLDDFLIFEIPPGKIEYLQLELDASAFGGEGKVQFQLPRAMIKVR